MEYGSTDQSLSRAFYVRDWTTTNPESFQIDDGSKI